ncbi:MAG: glyceraldehyde 3-phosphate dehydrogenase NAD-binding domain-containing protein, partial [Bacilli bacterium]
MKKIAINGFGRIGRIAFREIFGSSEYQIVAINSRSEPEELAYLLKYDTVYRIFNDVDI